METVVKYVRYNDSIKLAEIEISENEKFIFEINEYENDGNVEKRLDITAVSSLVSDGIKLSLTYENSKELQLLINQFAVALQKQYTK